ncbi:MAG TPA: BolA/IbaG family iron-sulfur metabolism protein [Candidatus Dormibacteraeota bacterium]|nr:BolA/IbaG family iron-sulfur metabolism protein [Candidatus Dormibacteraeota bacterium]
MITEQQIAELIRQTMPDAQVEAREWGSATGDHYDIRVVSRTFEGVPLIDRHRMVYAALDPALKDGRLHAAQLKTETPNAREPVGG